MTTHISKFNISIRRAPYFMLRGDDAALHNIKIGSSIKGKSVLRGLDYEEEKLYLPDIIGVSPQSVDWTRAVQNYWNDISVPVPADGETSSKLQGRIIEFTIEFKEKSKKEEFEKLLNFEKKAEVIAKHGKVIDGIDDYVLFRYCLVYGRVANSYEDVGKSPKIRFYLYSPRTETMLEHKRFNARTKARKAFIDMLEDEKMINAMLLIFNQDLTLYPTLEDKHLALEVFIEEQPENFLRECTDTNLTLKAFIKRAVEKQVLYNPPNTQSYYYGENKEICLGNTLEDTILYLKSTDDTRKEIVSAIKARVKN